MMNISLLLTLLNIFLFGISTNASSITNKSSETFRESASKFVIFDTDMGADDAWSLQILLHAEKRSRSLKVLAITTVDGNTDIENVIKNTYRIFDGVNRTDIPIYKGSSEAIIPIDLLDDDFYGKNGFGDLNIWKKNYPKDINSIIQQKSAVRVMRDLIMQYPGKISVLCLGPLTNIALAIKTYPEIKNNVKEIFLMGGSYKGRGNILPAVEFNFYKDPEAAFIVLHSMIPRITILPIDVDERLGILVDWRFNVLGQIDQPNVQLLNQIEKMAFKNEKNYTPYDALATTAFLYPNRVIEAMNPFNATMELFGRDTRGEMVVNLHSRNFNVNIIQNISAKEIKRIMLNSAHYND